MSRKISFIVTDSGIITAVAEGKSYPIPPDHRYYKELKEAVIKDDVVTLEKLANLSQTVATFAGDAQVAGNKVTVRDGVVFYGQEPLRNTLTDRILRLMNEGFPFDPFVKFLENLMLNYSKRSVDQLYNFLEHQGLPITEDGHFLAYKRVNADWTDIHSGKLSYTIGAVVEMPRNQVDDDPDSACSAGLHAGALSYVAGFNAGGHVIIVKINPRDCVSVPKDASCTKLRACRLEVVREFTGELHNALYQPSGAPSTLNQVEGDEEDEEDFDDEDEDDDEDDDLTDEDEDDEDDDDLTDEDEDDEDEDEDDDEEVDEDDDDDEDDEDDEDEVGARRLLNEYLNARIQDSSGLVADEGTSHPVQEVQPPTPEMVKSETVLEEVGPRANDEGTSHPVQEVQPPTPEVQPPTPEVVKSEMVLEEVEELPESGVRGSGDLQEVVKSDLGRPKPESKSPPSFLRRFFSDQ